MDAKRDEVRKIILSLLLARQHAAPIPVLDRDYYEVEGERIPWRKFGYVDIVEFLKSMPEHFVVEWYNGGHYVKGIASEKSKHVSSLVARQKSSDSKPRRPSFRFRQSTYPVYWPPVTHFVPHTQRQRIRIPAEQLVFVAQYVRNNPRGVNIQNVLQLIQKQLPHITLSVSDMREQLRELSHQLYLDGDMIYPIWMTNNGTQREENRNYQQSPLVAEVRNAPRLSENLPTTENVYIAGDEGSDITDEFCDDADIVPAGCIKTNCPKPRTSERLAANFAQCANREQNETFDHNDNNEGITPDDYFAMTNNIGNEETNSVKYDISSLISDRTKSRLEQLVQKHPEGIWCAELPEKYLEEYKVHLNYIEQGFNSVREYVSHLPTIFYMTQMSATDDFKLYSADKRPTIPDEKTSRIDSDETRSASREQHDEHCDAVQSQCGNDNDDAPIPPDAPPSITKKFAPEDVMNYGDNVDKISVTELQNRRKFLEVYIVEVFHPTFFWIHLRENKRYFEIFMEDLHSFYQYNKEKYTIPKIALKKDLNCACVYSNRWHRGIIKTVKPDFKVTVLFYDYGTLKTYAPEDIYYLHTQFSHLPAQAIPCGLANIRPCVGNRWKKSVSDKFIDKIDETLLAATITSIDPLYNSMMIFLTDTSEEEDVLINNWLLKENLARLGKLGDAVDMTGIMKYVLNNLNQLPTYCFAEESLMPDSRCKATSTEEINLVSPGPSHLYHDCYQQQQQQPMRPPPGFAPLVEQPGPSNVSTKSFHNCPHENPSNVKAPTFSDAETMTNPFLDDQPFGFIPSDVAKQVYLPIWNKNLQLVSMLNGLFCDLLDAPIKNTVLENHITVQRQLYKVLMGFMKVLTIVDDNQSIVSESSASNFASGTTPNNVGATQKTCNADTFANQEHATAANAYMSNSFGMNGGEDESSQNHTAFSAYGSKGFAVNANWSRPDEYSSHVQAPNPTSSSPAPSMFTNYGQSTANPVFPNVKQESENVPSMQPLSPTISTNTMNGSSNDPNSSGFISSITSEFVNGLKETNPFKLSITNEMHRISLETRNERAANSCDTNPASYLSVTDLPSYATNRETANVHVGSNNFTPVGHVKVVSDESYTPRIVYEAGPVMYNNVQRKQTDVDARQSVSYSSEQNASVKLEQCGKELSSQLPMNDIANTHSSSHVDEGYVTRPPTDYMMQSSPPTDYMMQSSPPIISGEPSYRQEGVKESSPITPQTWKQVEIPERWINANFKNSVPLQTHNEGSLNSRASATSLSFQQNCDNGKETLMGLGNVNGTIDSSHAFQPNGNDKQKAMHAYTNSWKNSPNIEKGRFESWNATSNFFNRKSSFIFQQIDSVKGVTFIFNIENEGWMLTHEFVETFTNLKLCSQLMVMLEAMNIKVAFKEVQRVDYPIQFLQLDRYPINVPRDSEKRIVSINLISLQAALTLLRKLKIVSREEIDNAFKRNEFLDDSVLPNLWVDIDRYLP